MLRAIAVLSGHSCTGRNSDRTGAAEGGRATPPDGALSPWWVRRRFPHGWYPENMRTLIGAYHSRITEVISPYQGIIARYMGDGVLVYFGYPQAHEDDAEQAVRAGLALVDAVAKLSTDTDAALSARIGIATGVAVVGDLTGEGAARERAAIGELRTSQRACKRWQSQGQC